MLTDEIKAAIAEHALAVYPHECCGLIAGGKYWPCKNIAALPTRDFEMDAATYALVEDQAEIQAVVHSHPGASEKPSEADLDACEASGLPWVIVSLGGQLDGSVGIEEWYEFAPSGYSAPLIGCPFSHGTTDCYGLVRRYYWQVYGVKLPDFYRASDWWDDGHSDLYTEGFPKARFVVRPRGEAPQPGDVLLMRIQSRNNVPNHAAVYVGGDTILHHTYGALSREDLYARYAPYVTHVLRYREDLCKKESGQSDCTAISEQSSDAHTAT
ncbi:C40 family peptidase [Burkholderia cenocepacia]|uniref:C40 family peptidase n=1 Tax=Burkholderia cenocepacia TaxID=95486 RepID=UPI0024B84845|nr:C40 family peptidase [Burkholderia cenocepacia]MDI9686559.1 C40 family peptidase [Burkholderia cenocepacia]